MYQAIVLGLGVLLVFGGGYLIKHTDTEGVITSSLSQTHAATTDDTTATIPGSYQCDPLSGCDNPHTLTLTENGEAKLDTVYESGAEVGSESGTWKRDVGGKIVILFTSNVAGLYDVPHVMTIANVTKPTLAGINFSANMGEGMHKPIFARIGE